MDFMASRQPECAFKIVGRAIKHQSYGFGFRKGSKWKNPISQLILKYKKRDYFHSLRKKWFSGVCANKLKSSTKAYQMEFKHFSGLFLACTLCVVCCFMLLLVEHMFYRFNRKIPSTYSLDSSNNSVREMTRNGNSMIRINKLKHRNTIEKTKQEVVETFTNVLAFNNNSSL